MATISEKQAELDAEIEHRLAQNDDVSLIMNAVRWGEIHLIIEDGELVFIQVQRKIKCKNRKPKCNR